MNKTRLKETNRPLNRFKEGKEGKKNSLRTTIFRLELIH